METVFPRPTPGEMTHESALDAYEGGLHM